MNSCQLVVFNLGNEEYAIDIKYAKEIIRIPKLTEIPNAPLFIEGIFNLRGIVTTVVNLKKRFEIEENEDHIDKRLLILDLDELEIGIVVDDISEVMNIEDYVIQSLGNEITTICQNSIEGIVINKERLIIVLNILKLKSEIFKYYPGRKIKA